MLTVVRWSTILLLLGLNLSPFSFAAERVRDLAILPDQSLDISEQEPPEELILEVELSGKVIGEVFGYSRGERTYLPVYELGELLGFQVELLEYPEILAADESPLLSGYSIVAEANRLTIRQPKQSRSWPDSVWLKEQFDLDGEFFLQTEYLMELWPVTLEVSVRAMALKITSEAELPKLAQLRRKAFRKKYLQKQVRKADQRKQGLPYGMYSAPIADWRLSQLEKRAGNSTSFGMNLRHDMMGVGTSSSLQATGNDGRYRVSSFSLKSRYDATNDPQPSESPLAVRLLEFGNISIPGSSVNDLTSGTGLSFSNRSGGRSVFATHSVSSAAHPGWEADLYLNQRLIGYQKIDETGLYSFDLDLPPGDNQVNVRLYGPYGEERIDRYVFEISPDYLPDGEWGYWVSALSPRTALYSETDGDEDIYRYILETTVGYGIGSGIDLRGRLTHKSSYDSGAATILGLTSNFSLGTVSVQAESYFEKGSLLAKLGLSYSNDDFDTLLTYTSHRDWPDALREQSELQESLSTSVRTSASLFSHPMTLGAGFSHKRYVDRSEKQLSLSQHFNLRALKVSLEERCRHSDSVSCSLTNRLRYRTSLARFGLEWTTAREETELSHAVTGRASVGLGTLIRRFQPWQLDDDAGHLQQTLDSLARSGRLTLEYDGEYSEQERAEGTEYGFHEGGLVTLSTTHDFRFMTMGVLASWSSSEGMSFRLNLSGSLYPGSKGYETDYQRFDRAAEVRVFNDLDYDGVFGEGDELLENVKVRQGNRTSEATGANGVAWFNMHSGVPLEVDYRTLEDPYMVPVRSAEVVPVRRERVARVEMPIISTGAIEGALLSPEGEAYPNRKLELVDRHTGKPVAEMFTAIDGFFVFEFIPPGDYTIVMHYTGDLIPLSELSLGPDDMWPVVDLTY